jgi:hypothetical protein
MNTARFTTKYELCSHSVYLGVPNFLTIDNICFALEYSPTGPSNRSTFFLVRYVMNIYIKWRSVVISKGLKMLSISNNLYMYI